MSNFRCFGPSGENLCFYGECSNTSVFGIDERCDCLDGFIHDYAFTDLQALKQPGFTLCKEVMPRALLL